MRYTLIDDGEPPSSGKFILLDDDDPGERIVEPSFVNRMFEGDKNADKPLLERGTNKVVMDAGRSVARQVSLAARASLQGLMAIPNTVGDALAALANAGSAGIEKVTGIPQSRYGSRTERFSAGLTDLGLAEPANANERVSVDVASAMAGGAGTMGLGKLMYSAANPVVSGVAGTLTSQPLLQTLSNMTGAVAASGVREAGGGPGAQLAAGLAGAFVPGATSSLPAEALRRLARGGEEGRKLVEQNLKTFADSGYGTPSVGQATERRLPRALESVLSKVPGASGRMSKVAEEGAEGLGARVDELAEGLAKGATSTKAGAAIERGIGRFIDEFKLQQRTLYDELDAFIPKGKPVDMTNTLNALSSLNADIPGAPALSKFFKNSTIQAIESAMKSDTDDFTKRLPYEAIKKLRTLVGGELEHTSLMSNVPRSKWKTLYGALSQDLAEAADQAGPEAQRAFGRANRYTAAGHDRIETYLDRVAGKDTVEKVFQAAVNPTEIKEGASTINAVMRSLPIEDRKIVQSAFLRRLGNAAAGKQDDVGEVFSPEAFLTNWNKTSDEAKRILFAGDNGGLRESLDKVAKVASNLRDGSKVFANPSGTSPALLTGGALGGALVAIFTGHPQTAAALGGAALGANVTARLLTNPTTVKWLAETTTKPVGVLPVALNNLAQLSRSMEEADRAAVEEFIEAARLLHTPGEQAR